MSEHEEFRSQFPPLTQENLAKNNDSLENEFQNEVINVELEMEKNDVVEDVKTLAQIIGVLLDQQTNLDDNSIVLPVEVKNIIYSLMEIDDFFDAIEDLLKDIVQDDKIDAKDVPKIMVLLANLHTFLKKKKLTFNEELCGYVLKFLFELIIKEKLIPVNDKEIELLHTLFEIIDTSVRLLQTDKVGSERKGIVYYVKKSFSRCFK